VHHPLSPAQRRRRRVKRAVLGTLALGIILAAAGVGALALAMPWLMSHPEQIREYLSEKLGRPVQFASVRASWHPAGPVFTLEQVTLLDPDATQQPFALGQAELALDFYAWMRRYGNFIELRLEGLSLEVTRHADGAFTLARFGGSTGDSNTLLDLAAVSLADARLLVRDEASGTEIRFARVDLRQVNGLLGRHYGGRFWADAGSEPIRFACTGDEDFGAGRCYVGGERLSIAPWLAALPKLGLNAISGTLNLGVWFEWDGQLNAVDVDARGAEWILNGVDAIPITDDEHVEGRTRFATPAWAGAWRRERAGGWRVDLAAWHDMEKEAPHTTFALRALGTDESRRYMLAAPRVDINGWLPFVALSRGLPDGLRAWLYAAGPRGDLRGLRAEWDANGADLRSELIGLSFIATHRAPGLEHLSARVLADRDALVLVADAGQPIRLDFAHVFRQPFRFNLDSLTLALLRDEEGLHFEATDVALRGSGYSARGRAAWHSEHSGAGQVLDATIELGECSVPGAKQFWPVNVMPRSTVQWLDRALVTGRITGGSVVFNGPLGAYPFKGREGRFEAIAHIVDADLDYHPDWPRAHIASATTVFADAGMDIQLHEAQVMGVRVGPVGATIADLKEPVLELDVHGTAPGERLLEFVHASPIRERGGKLLEGMRVGGSTELGFQLHLPLGDDTPEADLNGELRLAGSELSSQKLGIDFMDTNGSLRFTGNGFSGDALAVRYRDAEAKFSIAAGEFVRDPAHALEAQLDGRLSTDEVFATVPEAKSLLGQFSGRSDWRIAVASAKSPKPGEPEGEVTLRSDLVGTALSLPAPLDKPAERALPSEIRVGWPLAGSRMSIRLGSLLHGTAMVPAQGRAFAASLAFGSAEPLPLPGEGLSLVGTLPRLDLDGWGKAGGGSTPIAALDLGGEHVLALGQDFGAVRVRYERGKDGGTYSFEGERLQGTVQWPTQDLMRRGITARFERLVVPAAPSAVPAAPAATTAHDAASGDPDAPPTPASPASAVAAAPPAPSPAGATATPAGSAGTPDPAALPPLHVWTKVLKLGGVDFGETRVESYPQAGALRVEKFESRSPVLALNARGDWRKVDGADLSTFELDLTTEDLGRMLDAFGYVGMIGEGNSAVQFQGSWPGTPVAFSFARAEGTLTGKVESGRILDVDPGAGRLFGLINLSAIPRRLSLDFSDFFRTGMSFDSIDGSFKLHQGNAVTDDLALRAPAAVVKIRGRTGLAARDYDQEMDVQPKVGGVLTVVGALAAGPAGAAAGALVQNILSRPIRDASSARYKVTGSWDKPEVTLIERTTLPAAPAQNRQGSDKAPGSRPG